MTIDQSRRAEIVRVAREVSPHGTTLDLLTIATWIETGNDPWPSDGDDDQ